VSTETVRTKNYGWFAVIRYRDNLSQKADEPVSYEPRITLVQFAGELRMHPASAVALLPQDEIGPDWRGVLSVPAATAQRVLRERRDYERRHLAAQAEHTKYVRAWEARKRQAEADAFVEAKTRRLRKAPASTREAASAGHERAREAGLRFELREPLLPFSKWLESKHGKAFRA
jgi:hypothetical protein